ncbi:HAD-IB family phosphatase [Phormidium sp. CCY1219]|uniref:HAD-IB family phosphatase n=1 Tax=Phormidium sp. CCY1219 TaxID=2886104 RepID=UPI002D1ECF29|nr:HAD-IB family phosphatase [Phormidium sp. CCY1219]MEB3827850.1 HAD-IB family phosphatase [Phormidium sp. CCY1219]
MNYSQPGNIVFCDFDGTITTEDTFVKTIRKFTPEMTRELLPEIYALRLSLRQGVRQILESIPSRRYPEIIEFMRSEPIRSGFVPFLEFLEAQKVPVVIVSGGLRVIVETVLGELVDRVLAIHAIDVDTSKEYLQVHSDFEADTELVSKVRVMEKYPAAEQVAIGDSVTDLNMGLTASVVFARDRLAEYLAERQKSYIPWNDFFEVRDRLAERWN